MGRSFTPIRSGAAWWEDEFSDDLIPSRQRRTGFEDDARGGKRGRRPQQPKKRYNRAPRRAAR
jgi:hypothetical protein